jgi:(p)ppGpp synthase/HD superfamily hydrolase
LHRDERREGAARGSIELSPYGSAVNDRPSVEDAIALAARAHKGQRYASPEREPYIFHPLRMMLSLDDPHEQIVAVLHDAIEDTELELRHLVEVGYPPEVVAAVDAVTHRPDESYDDYIERVAGNELARRVKLADVRENLTNNLRLPASPANAERIARYRRAHARLADSTSPPTGPHSRGAA